MTFLSAGRKRLDQRSFGRSVERTEEDTMTQTERRTVSRYLNLAGATFLLVYAALIGLTSRVSAQDRSTGPRLGEGHALLAMNEDQFQGKWKQFKGELKRKWAEFTDDDLLYIEGSLDKLDGKIQERYGDRKEEVKQWVDEWFEQLKSEKSE